MSRGHLFIHHVNKHSFAYHLAAGVLRVALLVTLAGANWSIYRGLPSDSPASAMTGINAPNETALLIVLRRTAGETNTATDIQVELFETDIAAVWREYSSEPRPGVRFEDFLARQLKGRPTVTARLDQRGQTTVMLTPGRWLLRALIPGTENIEWRLPVNISGRSQTLELTPDNAYARTQSF